MFGFGLMELAVIGVLALLIVVSIVVRSLGPRD
jgi:hypothetical protein